MKKYNNENTSLTLFFTKKTSLGTWAQVGNLDREIEIYKRLSDHLKKVNFVTYGDKQDRIYSNRTGAIKLLPIKWHKIQLLTILHLLIKHSPEIKDTDILKTNQISGSEIPLWIKKHLGKKLIVRCGYLHSYCTKKRTKDKKTIKEAIRLEQRAFSSADLGIVTAKWQRDTVVKNYNIDPEKIKIIPNYVVTDIFKPYPGFKKEFDLIYIGRSKENKNLRNLLKALNSLKRKDKKLSLLLIGESYRDKRLRETALQYNLNVTFKDNLPNFKLPLFLNKCRAFILPSLYEGHPKSLIEAMSCGLPCIGCNVTGVNEVIDHMETGYLCNTDHESIAEAIDAVLGDKTLCRYIGENARSFILNNYSLDKIFKLELAAIRKVLGV
jgi:glycosyltransferase involved in cell wall biosynthesis